MKKELFESVLDKYYLNGIIEKAKIKIDNDKIYINCINSNKDLIAVVELNNESIPAIGNAEIGIYDSKQLIKLVSVTDDELEIKLEGKNNIFRKLNIKDLNVNIEYILADLNLIPNSAKVSEPEYNIFFNIESEFINKFLKIKKSLDTDLISIEPFIDKNSNNFLKFIIGGKKDYNHKINIMIPVENIGIPGWCLNFNLSYIKEIIESNKYFKEGKCFLNEEGLLKFEFISKDSIISKYILVAHEDS